MMKPLELPPPVRALALLDRTLTRLWVALACSCLTALVATGFGAWTLADSFRSVRFAWVKLQPEGSWDVDLEPIESPIYLDATINHLLFTWSQRRWRLRRATIEHDYGYALALASDDYGKWLTDPDGGGLVETARQFLGCADCDEIKVEVRKIQHYERDQASSFSPLTTYRSHVYADLVRLHRGSVINREQTLFNLAWQLRAPEQLTTSDLEDIRYNPIGLQIIGAQRIEVSK